MSRGRKFLLLGVALLLVAGAGCGRKKMAVSPTLVANVPSATPAPAPPPSPAAGPPPSVLAEPGRALPPEPAPPSPEPSPAVAAKKTTPSTPAPPSPDDAPRVDVPPGPSLPVPGQLSAALSREDLLQRRSTTSQLLGAAEQNLKNLTRSLSNDETAVLQDIRTYVKQSRSATEMGDIERAYNLALKAHLLSEELIKR